MITDNNFIDITISITWNSPLASHKDVNYLQYLNASRDFLYEFEPQILTGLKIGHKVKADKKLLEKYFCYEKSKKIIVKKNEIKSLANGLNISPKIGRFYPKGILKGVSNIFEVNVNPFRCLEIDEEKNQILCDLNHPLAGKNPEIEIEIIEISEKKRDTGAGCKHLLEEIGAGPGMQARFEDMPTDFFSGDPFEKTESVSDEEFYEKPRITAHIDSLCRENLKNLNKDLIKKGDKILDLMTSVHSHLPEETDLNVTGIGMNMEEMDQNKRLDKKIILDLNKTSNLPFDDDEFNFVQCAMSIEYLKNPKDIFKEVKRVLKKDGIFCISFSNRWFPGKEIKIWNQLHDFEKPGFILELFHLTQGFGNLNTISMKGFPRPYEDEDRYKDTLWYSDPLFAVYGQKI